MQQKCNRIRCNSQTSLKARDFSCELFTMYEIDEGPNANDDSYSKHIKISML